jgi:GNAT superfamily N-acetyltransferase
MATSEALRIDDLGLADIDGGMVLSTEAGWNQTADDWRRFIVGGRAIGVRDGDGRLVASAAALPYDGPFGFVGMVLVTESWRRRGIATRLVDRCVEALQGERLVPVLDATADGAKVYARQGFLPQFTFDRWQGTLAGSSSAKDAVADPASLAGLDAAAFGAARPALLRDFVGRPGTIVTMAEAGDGFAMLRHGRRALQAGPVVAATESGALALLRRLFATAGGALFIDVPSIWAGIARWLADAGFTIQRSFTRMALGRAEPFGDPSRLFAVAGPEFG